MPLSSAVLRLICAVLHTHAPRTDTRERKAVLLCGHEQGIECSTSRTRRKPRDLQALRSVEARHAGRRRGGLAQRLPHAGRRAAG